MRTLNHFGADYCNPLVCDIAETYGDSLQNMSEPDQMWLLYFLGEYYSRVWCDEELTAEAQEVHDRLDEIPGRFLKTLILALTNKSNGKSLIDYPLDFDYELITDIYETYGDSLQNISKKDQSWLIGAMSDFYLENHTEPGETVSDEAFEVRDRVEDLEELEQSDCWALIQALANK